MSVIEITLAVVLGLVVNEFTSVSPWLARKMVAWSARLRYGQTSRAEIRAEELVAVINDRPGNLFKLATGTRFATSAAAVRLRRLIYGAPEPTDPTPDDVLDGPIRGPILEDEPTTLVARYLFPTERYRGEWKRHWIHLAKSWAVIGIYGFLGIWLVRIYIRPQYRLWFTIGIVAATALAVAYRFLGWYFKRVVITNKRLMTTEGVIMRQVAMLPLLRVTDVRYVQWPLGRLLNYGTFKLEGAGRFTAMRKLDDLPHPNELYLRLVEEMYEPQAVEARLDRGYVDWDEDPDPEADGPAFGGASLDGDGLVLPPALRADVTVAPPEPRPDGRPRQPRHHGTAQHG